MNKLTIVTGFLSLILALVIYLLIKRDKLRAIYAVYWSIVGILALIIGFFPKIIDKIGSNLGIYYPPILFIIVVLIFLMIKIITMDIERTDHERKIRKLAQKISLLEKKIKDFEHQDL